MASKVKVRVCSWNVGSVQTPANLTDWLMGYKSGREESNWPDLIVIGIQEVGAGRTSGNSLPDSLPTNNRKPEDNPQTEDEESNVVHCKNEPNEGTAVSCKPGHLVATPTPSLLAAGASAGVDNNGCPNERGVQSDAPPPHDTTGSATKPPPLAAPVVAPVAAPVGPGRNKPSVKVGFLSTLTSKAIKSVRLSRRIEKEPSEHGVAQHSLATPRSTENRAEGVGGNCRATPASPTPRTPRLQALLTPRNRATRKSLASGSATPNNRRSRLPSHQPVIPASTDASAPGTPASRATDGVEDSPRKRLAKRWAGRFSKSVFGSSPRETRDAPDPTRPVPQRLPSDESCVWRVRAAAVAPPGAGSDSDTAGTLSRPTSSSPSTPTPTAERAARAPFRGSSDSDDSAGGENAADGDEECDGNGNGDAVPTVEAQRPSMRSIRGLKLVPLHRAPSAMGRVGERLKATLKMGTEKAGGGASVSGLLGSTAQLRFGANQRRLEDTLLSSLPEGYRMVCSKWMWQIGMVVMVNERTMSNRMAEKPEVWHATAGIGNVMGNKGAVWAKVVVDDGTKLCFVNSHLAAHEGEEFKQARHEQVEYIMQSIGKGHNVPMVDYYDHIFWCGDLNYRLDGSKFPREAVKGEHGLERGGGAKSMKKAMVQRQSQYVKAVLERRETIREADGSVVQERVQELERMDELKCAMREGEVFCGFKEGRLSFAPTFKVDRRGGSCGDSGAVAVDEEGWLCAGEYQGKRTPAYCDRVLWRSKASYASHVKQREYGCVAGYGTSDHKPVFATFDLVMPQHEVCKANPSEKGDYVCTLEVVSVEMQEVSEGGGNPVLSSGGSSDSSSSNTNTNSNPNMFNVFRTISSERREVAIEGDGMFVSEKRYEMAMEADGGEPARGSGAAVRTSSTDTTGNCVWRCKPSAEEGSVGVIPLKGVRELGQLKYKDVMLCFRGGRRKAWKSGCTLPLSLLLPGEDGVLNDLRGGVFWGNEVRTSVKVTSMGKPVANATVHARLTVCKGNELLRTWVNSDGDIVHASR